MWAVGGGVKNLRVLAGGFILPAALLTALLLIYGSAGRVVLMLSALLFCTVLYLAAFLYRYVPAQVSFPYIRAVYIAGAFLIAFVFPLAVYAAAYGGMGRFVHDFLLFAVTGIYLWIAITRSVAGKSAEAEDVSEIIAEPPPAVRPRPERITVKKGNSIRIIEKEDILYIAATGDYVSIVTPAGRFVKEGTMTYYSGALGDGFARIHRSTIVNISRISAVELYGRNSYSVKLTSGESLRASASGYRSLMDQLR